jgi:polyisoprenoid-binding protein YceI
MLKRLLLICTIVALPFTAISASEMTPARNMPSGIYDLDLSHASLTWKVNHLGLSHYTARFTKINAQLDFDASNPLKSTVVAKIDPTSVETDFPYKEKTDFNKKLGIGAEWFNGIKYPQITFKSTKIERTEEMAADNALVYGDLTFLGVTKPVVLNVRFNGAYESKPYANVPALGFSAKSKIKRSDFGLATYVPMIGDDVDINIEAEFNKIAASR